MVRVTDDLALSPDATTLYHAADPLLGHLPVLAFHGPSTTANFTHNSSRIQVHVYSPAGFVSFPRLTISPQSELYAAVNRLPREFQGDDVCRGLAFALFKYFCELPDAVKAHLRQKYPSTRGRRPGSATALFGEQHAADLAQAMVGADPAVCAHVVHALVDGALQPQHVSNLDLDVVLPPGSIAQPDDEEDPADDDDDAAILDPTLRQYDAAYMPVVKLLGEPVFLPTSKLRRAPSRPSSLNHHRSKTFSRDSKVELRMQMGELVDTEERYVLKLKELVKNMADDVRADPAAFGVTDDQVDRLFPRSVDAILQANTAFMQELRRVMDASEEDAVRDLDAPYVGSASSRTMLAHGPHGPNGPNGPSGPKKDPSGALAMARAFLEWFPKFTDCYQDYIRASQHFPQLLNTLLDASTVPNRFRDRVVQTTGEQALRSALIEPVQRLPRYSLFIDQIVGCLPITHPALSVMLKARDIITNICSMDDPVDDEQDAGKRTKTINRLRNLVEGWPCDLEPSGRLILAADWLELAPPFVGGNNADKDKAGLFLLFNDCLVLVTKTATTTARDLLREIDKPSPAGLLASMTNAAGGPGTYDFAFAGWHTLADVRFTESADGRCVWMASTGDLRGTAVRQAVRQAERQGTRCFALQESYEAKAARWSEDVTKARIEGRFSEAERETPTWTMRSVKLPETNNRFLGLHAAVFQEAVHQLVEGRRDPAPVRIVFDNHRGTKGAPLGHYGVEIVVEVRVSTTQPGTLVMNSVGLSGKRFTDETTVDDFLPTVVRRITQLTGAQHSTANQRLIPALVAYHTKTLRSLDYDKVPGPSPSPAATATTTHDVTAVASTSSRAEKTRSFLASSPVKLLSSILGGGPSSTSATTSATNASVTESLYGSVRLHRSQSSASRPALSQLQSVTPHSHSEASSLAGSIRDRTGAAFSESGGDTVAGGAVVPENPLVRLEQTFTGYVAALHARQGQFVARTLLNRNAAGDELAVNALYNRMNESPFDWADATADVPAGVVFAAFEKFARIAWREHMGTIMTIAALDALQERAAPARKVPGDFADFVRFLFGDMAPQNRRAFTALVKLLAELLQGCSDDGDRGALTLAFADVLVAGSSEPAHNYINLLDRLVDDCDRIFDGIGSGYGGRPALSTASHLSHTPSVSASIRTQRTATTTTTTTTTTSTTPSLASNASSLRRKFGLEGLLRQNAAAGDPAGIEERERERSSMWRSLSKHRHPATGESASLSKATAAAAGAIARSRSIDMGSQEKNERVEKNEKSGGFAAYAGGNGAFGVAGRRPGSRGDRLPVAGAFYPPGPGVMDDGASAFSFSSSVSSQHRPGSSHRPASSHKPLETIGEPADVPETPVVKKERKKRRSSLSDLKSLMAAASLEPSDKDKADKTDKTEALTPLRTKTTAMTAPTSTPRLASKIPVSPPSLVRGDTEPRVYSSQHAVHHSLGLVGTPGLARHQSLQTPRNKENGGHDGTPPSHIPTLRNRPVLAHPKQASTPMRQLPSLPSQNSTQNLLSPAPLNTQTNNNTNTTQTNNNTNNNTNNTNKTTTRLRLQSPQKLRERLQSEKRAVEATDAALRSELSRITADMARLGSSDSSLAGSVRALEAAVPQQTRAIQERQAALEALMEASVRASESKVRAIDQLYKEATAENELLYEKFNTELGKIVRALRGKGREDKEELVAKLKEQTEETARLRRENARLQREAVSLRAVLKEQQ